MHSRRSVSALHSIGGCSFCLIDIPFRMDDDLSGQGPQVDPSGLLRSSLIAGPPSSAKISGLDLLVTIRLAAIHCLGGSFRPVDGMPSRILGRRSRSRPAAAKRAANGGGLEGDRWSRNNAETIGRAPNVGQCPSRQVPTSIHQDIFGSPIEWFLPSLIVTSSACSCRFRGSLRGQDIACPTMVSESCGVSM
jgi:hypothetical protein